jgi:tRNA(Ile)-lysidine synthase
LVRTLEPSLPLDTSLLKPGMRLAVGLSGGADSVALLCALAQRSRELGLVLHAAHLHHGLRGDEADGDLEFCRDLAARLQIPFHQARVDTAAEARANPGPPTTGPGRWSGNPATGKRAESIEEAARRLRYAWFKELLTKTPLDAVATAHTLDDQAETVLAKFLRGAWTSGLAAIYQKLEGPEGRIIRPLLQTTRAQIEAFLNAIGQPWREDSSNRQLSFTRNRIRHELLPELEKWNPQIRTHLANMSTLARDEESWWQTELDRIAPQMILRGRPVRGGGRASSEDLALDCTRLSALAPALQRRLLRRAAAELGAEPDFAATEALLNLALRGHAGQRLELGKRLTAERSPRELRFSHGSIDPAHKHKHRAPSISQVLSRNGWEADTLPAGRISSPRTKTAQAPKSKSDGALQAPLQTPVPGQIDAPAFGLSLKIDLDGVKTPSSPATATLRNWRPGDRVRLRYSSGPRKVKEVLEHLRVTGSERTLWPVLEFDGRLIWMQGVELEPEPGLIITARPFGSATGA